MKQRRDVENDFVAARGSRRAVADICDTDARMQYTSGPYRARPKKLRIEPSMSRTGDCYDSAMVESFRAKKKTPRPIRGLLPEAAE